MRKLLIANLLLGVLLAPALLALGGDEAAKLRERLSLTVGALSDFVGLQARIDAQDPKAMTELLAASEAGPSESVQAEIDLANLRARVGALQEILDKRAAESGIAPPANRDVEPQRAIMQAHGAATTTATLTHTDVAAPASNTAARNKFSFEVDGFVADRSRLGRACWRGGRFLEGVAALEPLAGQPQADYWRARCLEKLSRNSEALELYRKVVEVSADSPEGRSAREDLEFLQWSMAHGLVTKP